jgi:hypothetical protein
MPSGSHVGVVPVRLLIIESYLVAGISMVQFNLPTAELHDEIAII